MEWNQPVLNLKSNFVWWQLWVRTGVIELLGLRTYEKIDHQTLNLASYISDITHFNFKPLFCNRQYCSLYFHKYCNQTSQQFIEKQTKQWRSFSSVDWTPVLVAIVSRIIFVYIDLRYEYNNASNNKDYEYYNKRESPIGFKTLI